MAADPKKKQEQEVQTPPVPQDSTPVPQPAPTISSEEQELIDSNNQLLEATKASNQASINSVADFIGEYERQKQAKIAEDETLRKREEAYRYITGLGDTLSGIANLVGVAHGAANQPQKYNSSEFMRKAEEARAKRKQDLENLDQKIKEQRLRLDQVKSAASLQEAQLQAKAEREQLDLKRTLKKEAEEKARADRRIEIDAQNAESARIRAEAYEYGKENPTPKPTTDKSKIVKVVGADGKVTDFDVSRFKNFDADYQRAFDAAVKAGTSGLTPEEIEAYNKAVKLASADSNKALKEFFRTHTYRKDIVDKMQSGANNPKYK